MKVIGRMFKLLLAGCSLALPLPSHAQYNLDWFTIDAGGGPRSNGVYRVNGTVGQPVTGDANSSRYNAQLGFWSGITDIGQTPNALPDLIVNATASSNVVTEGDQLTFSLSISNAGSGPATATRLGFAAGAGLTIGSAISSQGSCTLTPSGAECLLGNLAPGQSATVALTGSFNELPGSETNLQESVLIVSVASAGSAESDVNPANNAITLAVAGFPLRDFGDADVPPTCGQAGARHRIIAGYSLGNLVDAESGCQTNDDERGSVDDSDGVQFGPAPPWVFLPGMVVSPKVTVRNDSHLPAYLDAWLDADGVAGFDPADRIYTALPLTFTGAGVLPPFTVPLTAPLGNTWIRVRLSETGLGTPGGYGGAGEVEDYPVKIVNDPPTVALTSPTAGSSFNAGAVITLIASASAANGKTITSVTFNDNGTDIGTDSTSPYTMDVSTFSAGTHILRARAVDSFGLVTVSEPVGIAVVAPCSGQVFTWTGAVSTDWADAANWTTPGGVPTSPPGSTDVVNVNSGTVTINANTTVCILNFNDGTIDGSANLTVSSLMNWRGGNMTGSGKTIVEVGATCLLANSGDVTITARTFEIGGTVAATGTADLDFFSGMATNRAGGVWLAQATGGFYNRSGTGRFFNAGTYRKVGGSTISCGIPFINSGLVDVVSGTVNCANTLTNSGLGVAVATGATLQLSGGGWANAPFSNAGRLEWAAGNYTLSSGTSFSGAGTNSVNGGTLVVDSDVTMRNLELTGTIDGTGNLTISNRLTWTAGAMSGSGRTIIESGATCLLTNNAGSVKITSRTLENGGTVLAPGTGGIEFDDYGVVTNRAGARWEAQAARGFRSVFALKPGRFDNAGTFRKVGAGVTTTFSDFAFNNYGTNHVENGTLQFSSTYTQYSGETSLCVGNIDNSSPLEITGGVFKGTGAVSGSVNISGTGTNDLGCSPGQMVISGNYSQSATATLQAEIGGTAPGVSFDQLVVGGVATLGGTLVTKFVNGFEPPANADFACLAAGSRSGTFANFSYPSNSAGLQLIYVGNNATLHVVNVRPNIPMLADRTIDELAPFSLAVNATDDDLPAQTLTYTLTNSPAGATISSNGVIQWTPTEAQGPTTTNITVRVTDNGSPNLTASRTFQLTVHEVNDAPQLTPLDNYIVDPGQTIQFNATATDADVPANSLIFRLVNPPTGATIDARSGAFTWPVPVALAGTTNSVTVQVVDNGLPPLSATRSFDVAVQGLGSVVLKPLGFAGGSFQFSVAGPAGWEYILQRSEDLISWTSFLTNTPTSLPFNVSDTNAPTSNSQFYRVLLSP